MWFVYLKILYDSSPFVKVLVWAFIVYIIGFVLFVKWGLAGIIILLLVIIAAITYLLMLSRVQRQSRKQINNRKTVSREKQLKERQTHQKNKQIEITSITNLTKEVNEIPCKDKNLAATNKNEKKTHPVFKKKLSNDEAELEFKKSLEKHPNAINEISFQDGDPLYRVYWLALGKNEKKKQEEENPLFDIEFAFAKDCQGMVISITNTCNEDIDVGWKYLMVNRKNVFIDKIHWIDYKGNSTINPNETVSKIVQLCVYKKGQLEKMYDLDRIKKEELKFEITFDVKCGKRAKRKYSYSVYTKMKVIF